MQKEVQNVDYHSLCSELFRTDNANELVGISQTYKLKNPHKAGQKKKFTAEGVQTILNLIENEITANDAAVRFKTSLQFIVKFRNENVKLPMDRPV